MSKLVNKKAAPLIRIDPGFHKLLKIKAAQENTTIKRLVEGLLAELFAAKGDKKLG